MRVCVSAYVPATFYELVNNLTTFLHVCPFVVVVIVVGIVAADVYFNRAKYIFAHNKYLHTFGALMKIT